jgi:hypothetical protein
MAALPCLAALSLGCLPKDPPPDEGLTGQAPLSCTVSCDDLTCNLGEVPAIQVRITNDGGEEVYLVGSLDGSDCRMRFPHCYFEITGPDGNPAERQIGRCGNTNPLREQDFVKVLPGGSFDPYQRFDDYGFFGCSQLSPETFREPGDYRVRFVYSTAEPQARPWLGDGREAPGLTRLLAKVPRTTVTSNTLTVTVVAR